MSTVIAANRRIAVLLEIDAGKRSVAKDRRIAGLSDLVVLG